MVLQLQEMEMVLTKQRDCLQKKGLYKYNYQTLPQRHNGSCFFYFFRWSKGKAVLRGEIESQKSSGSQAEKI